jgi:hypothetical protein
MTSEQIIIIQIIILKIKTIRVRLNEKRKVKNLRGAEAREAPVASRYLD